MRLEKVSAGPLAELIPQPDRVPDRGRDIVAVPDIQRQARAGEAGAELLPAQERGQPARAGHQRDRLARNRLLERYFDRRLTFRLPHSQRSASSFPGSPTT